MTKKDYVLLVEALHAANVECQIRAGEGHDLDAVTVLAIVASAIASVAKLDNPQFDEDAFNLALLNAGAVSTRHAN